MRFMIAGAAVPFLSLIFCGCLARETSAAGNVLEEFRFDAYPAALLVPVRFGGREYPFVLDTGCANTIVDPDMVPALAKAPAAMLIADADNTIEAPLYRAEGWKLGAISLPALKVCSFRVALTRLLPERVYGFIGMDFLRHFIVQIDFDAGRILFLRSVPRDAGHQIVMQPRNSDVCPVIKASIGSDTTEFLLDTGALHYAGGSLQKRDFDAMVAKGVLQVVETAPRLPLSTRGAWTTDRAAVMTTPFVVGTNQHVGLVFRDSANPNWTVGLVGVGYLRRYKIAFDFPGRAVYLAPGAQFAMVDASYDPGGLRFRRVADGIRAYGVAGPAWDVGIRPNDSLERVNSEAVAGIDNVRLAQLLSGSDMPISLVLRSAVDGRALIYTHNEQAARSRAIEFIKRGN